MLRIRELCRPLSPSGQCRPGQPRFDGPLGASIELGRTRLLVVGGFFLLAFALIAGRLVDVTMLQGSGDPNSAAAHSGKEARPVLRGEIIDRNGELLATNVVTWSLYGDPKLVLDPARTAARLAVLFPDIDRADLAKRLSAADRRFVWIRRHLTPNEYQDVIALGLPGIAARKDHRRIYPHGALTAHIVGFADIDNRGIAGVERYFDGRLRHGETITLAVDVRVQDVLREELKKAMEHFRAIGAMGTVVNVHTGEVVAMVSLPEFNPHDPGDASAAGRFNRVTLGSYEMGSTMKILNTAMVLDSGIATLQSRYDATHPLHYGRYTIHDFENMGRWLTVAEIFEHSSNIGSARMAMQAGTPRQRAFMGRAGMLKPIEIELPEVGAPLFPRDWRPINTITIAFGHGISVSPLQLAAAVAGIVNDGERAPVTLLKRDPREKITYTRIVKPKTSAELRELMRLVVLKGTGRRADAPGYLVGGKTGTADKSAGRRGYRHNARIASFIAAFPINAPRYVVLAMVDEPKPTKDAPIVTGGVVAAPAVKEFVLKAAPLLGVLPVETTSEVPDGKDNPKAAPASRPPKSKTRKHPSARIERAAMERNG
jgi:cell division protein FtsI (penicillin-binding protein 3)